MDKKTVSLEMGRITAKTFLLGICFGILYLSCIWLILRPAVSWVSPEVLVIAETVIPPLAGCAVCLALNRRRLGLVLKGIRASLSARRLLCRLFAACCFTAFGYFIESIGRNVSVPYDGFLQFALRTLLNFFFYLLISLFLLTYSLTEYFFVKTEEKQDGIPAEGSVLK